MGVMCPFLINNKGFQQDMVLVTDLKYKAPLPLLMKSSLLPVMPCPMLVSIHSPRLAQCLKFVLMFTTLRRVQKVSKCNNLVYKSSELLVSCDNN